MSRCLGRFRSGLEIFKFFLTFISWMDGWILMFNVDHLIRQLPRMFFLSLQDDSLMIFVATCLHGPEGSWPIVKAPPKMINASFLEWKRPLLRMPAFQQECAILAQ